MHPIRWFIALTAFTTIASAQIEVVSGGNVGIGTTSPTASLDVNGTLLARGGAIAAGNYGVKAVGAAGADRDVFLAGAAGLSNGFTVQRVGGAMKYVFNDGNVGVGVSSPGYSLDVNGVANATDFRGTIGATTPNSAAVTSLTVAPSTTTNPVKIQAWSTVTTYGMLSFNNNFSANNSLGLYAGGGTDKSLYYHVPSGGGHTFAINGSSVVGFAVGSTGVRFYGYGAGTLQTDSSGNVTATSDARAKDTVGDFTTGLAALRQLQPKKYHWKQSTGLNTADLNVSVYAQDLLAAGVPEAVFAKAKDDTANGTKYVMYTVSDRAVISVIINAAKELAAKNDALEARVAALEAQLKKAR